MQRGVGAVRLGQHVRRGALEEGQLGDVVHDRGQELDRAGAGPDDRHPPAGEVVAVVPARRVERRAGERVESRQVGDHGPVQLAERGDQHVRDDLLAARGVHRPRAGALVVRRPRHLDAGAHVVEDAGLRGGALQVLEDLRLPGVAVAPAGVGRPGPGVERRRGVAGRVRVGVVAPDAAHLVGLLEDGDVRDAGAEQLGGDAEAAEAGADDDDTGFRGAHGVRRWSCRRRPAGSGR